MTERITGRRLDGQGESIARELFDYLVGEMDRRTITLREILAGLGRNIEELRDFDQNPENSGLLSGIANTFGMKVEPEGDIFFDYKERENITRSGKGSRKPFNFKES